MTNLRDLEPGDEAIVRIRVVGESKNGNRAVKSPGVGGSGIWHLPVTAEVENVSRRHRLSETEMNVARCEVELCRMSDDDPPVEQVLEQLVARFDRILVKTDVANYARVTATKIYNEQFVARQALQQRSCS